MTGSARTNSAPMNARFSTAVRRPHPRMDPTTACGQCQRAGNHDALEHEVGDNSRARAAENARDDGYADRHE